MFKQDISKMNFKKEVGITIKSKKTSVSSHAAQPVRNTELYVIVSSNTCSQTYVQIKHSL